MRRLIPAHAGKTLAAPWTSWLPPAHPRSRGENRAEIAALQTRAGSSPLTRGKLLYARDGLGLGRLIPAHAGKTLISLMVVIGCPAHPRSRGENSYADKTDVTGNGSSPLTRGKPHTSRPGSVWGRLIPAHAGKTTRNGQRSLF